jgi:hypothetical protein
LKQGDGSLASLEEQLKVLEKMIHNEASNYSRIEVLLPQKGALEKALA